MSIRKGVTEIGDVCLAGNGRTAVTLPDGLQSLGRGAFDTCTSLTNTTLPAAITAVPGKCFADCTKLLNVKYAGTVTAIDPNGKNNGGNSKYTVTITMPRAENRLDGMNAMAVLTVGTTENVLWLPAEALAEQGFKTVVYTGFDAKTGELTGPVEVVTGVSDGDKVEIVSGLEEGQTVWYIAYESAEAALFSGAAAPESA